MELPVVLMKELEVLFVLMEEFKILFGFFSFNSRVLNSLIKMNRGLEFLIYTSKRNMFSLSLISVNCHP